MSDTEETQTDQANQALKEDLRSMLSDFPDRVIMVVYLGALTFIQIALTSDYLERTGAPAGELNTVYALLALILILYVAHPIAAFSLKYRDTTIGKAFGGAVILTVAFWGFRTVPLVI